MSAEDFDTLLKMVNRWKALLLLISVPLLILSSFSSGYGWHVHFSLCPALNLSHEIFPLFCVLFVLHNSVDAGYIYIYFKSFGGSFTWHILQKFANEHSLFNRMCSSHALPWVLTHDWAPISRPALTRWGTSCVTRLWTLISFFLVHSGHRH